MKKIEFDQEARDKLLSGVEKLNAAVSSTLGAKGRNVIFQIGNTYGVTKDGATVAANVQLEDPIENAACQIVKEAAARTARDAGDGTTTSTVLAHNMIKMAMNRINTTKANPMDLKRGIDAGVYDLVSQIEKMKIDVEDDSDDLYNIASISSNGDPFIANLISDIFKKVGRTGVVRMEHTQMTDTMSHVVEGCQLNAGMLSPSFATKNSGEAEYENPLILITDKNFTGSVQDIVPAIEIAVAQKSPLLIVCGGMEGEALGSLVINKMKQKLPVVAVVAPEFGEKRMEILEDIATITGGAVISEQFGSSIEEMTLDGMGSADHIIADKDFTTIIGRHGDDQGIQDRYEAIKALKDSDMHKQETWRLDRRIASLTGGIGVIYVGGNSDTEMKDSYYRIEDALSATKAALESGYVAGGGIAYMRATNRLKDLKISHAADIDRNHNSDFHIGYKLALDSMFSPFIAIVTNCGAIPSEILHEVEQYTKIPIGAIDKSGALNENVGYNAANGEVVDMINKGIIDPVKVVVTAIKNAASVAGMILTTNVVIYDDKQK